MWIESFPSNELKTLSEPLNKIFKVISNSNLHNEISSYENLYRELFISNSQRRGMIRLIELL